MNYTTQTAYTQIDLFSETQETPVQSQEYLLIPSTLSGFHNTSTELQETSSIHDVLNVHGVLDLDDSERVCPDCGAALHINGYSDQSLRHLPVGQTLLHISFPRAQFLCPLCGHTHMQRIPFKAEHHRITTALENYTCSLLEKGYTNKQVSQITGLGQNTVKTIDKRRLLSIYTRDGSLIQPGDYAKFLGIDEFKLHNHHKYATHIIDMSTGHILWIAEGKKKKVVYDFMEHVGMEWMQHVVAVAMDMNSDFQEAFQDKCPHVRVVYDHFHIVKNFNEKVVSEIRKAEEVRLIKEGKKDAAKTLKRSGRILTIGKAAMEKMDKEASDGKVIRKGSELFGIAPVQRKGGITERYQELIRENDLLTTVDLVKAKLADAYAVGGAKEMIEAVDRLKSPEERMEKILLEILEICEASQNCHLLWFKRLLTSHWDGIISHATYMLSSGKIEGINNKIKTLRRQGYGYPDDEYFFLKLMDASRQKSH